VQQITTCTVDFGASDTPMKNDEMAKAKGGPILHIPLTLGAVVPAYNVKGLRTGLKFDGDTLGKIFAGTITNWSDPALKNLNPDVTMPDEPIAVAHRSDGSGTTAVWSDYLTKESPTWVQMLGGPDKSFGKDIAWPVGIGGKGNEGVSGVINQTEGGLGYVELAYAIQQNLKYGQVKNKAGNFIQACIATITKGTEGTSYPPDLRTSLTDGPDPNAFPITGTTYALVYTNQTDPAKAKALVNFFSWVLSTGQDDNAQINYAPLGKDLQSGAMGQLKLITLNGQPVAS
jgi:phosphate transport system substrate-binding protein